MTEEKKAAEVIEDIERVIARTSINIQDSRRDIDMIRRELDKRRGGTGSENEPK